MTNCHSYLFLALAILPTSRLAADEKSLAEKVTKLEPNVIAVEGKITKEQRNELRRMLSTDIRARRRKANEADVKLWRSIKTIKQWEKIRDERIAALKKSLGEFPRPPKSYRTTALRSRRDGLGGPSYKVKVTKTIPGDGFTIENILFQSRPGLWVTANLYRPAGRGRRALPGILICHSHHRPKTQGELQDMGMIWARAGCYVLVMDQLGHGERRAHPFALAKDYSKRFRVSRQDYHFRYNTGMQLHLLGDSLIGWMAWDMMRGVDLLLSLPKIDSKKIILLGAVAGGGDPCAVTAAIDERITAAVPFNYGGPQPENVYPLPKDAALSFNYMGGGSWESTRNLRNNGRDGFLPWVIVGSIAPRRLVYAHEFSWHKERDPVWKRFQALYKMYGKPEHLASTHGYGRVSMPSSKASHCTNIGSHHRKAGIYAAFEKWFGIPAPKKEYRNRVSESKLLAATTKLPPMHKVAGKVADERIKSMHDRLNGKPAKERRKILRTEWKKRLGDIEPAKPPKDKPAVWINGLNVTRLVLKTEPGIRVPLLMLMPPKESKSYPVVVCVSQSGKAAFLKNRAASIAKFLDAGCAVCLPDLRGTGETRPGTYRGRRSYATGLSSSELMLGGTMVGKRLKDLRSVLALLRSWRLFDNKRIALWGDSFAKINAEDRNVAVPMPSNEEPAHSEPLGHLLVLLTALFEDDVKAVVSHRGGLVSFRSVLESQFVYIPHDAVVPGAIETGDLPLLASVASPLWVAGLVDGENKRAEAEPLDQSRGGNRVVKSKPDSAAAAKWLIEQLQ